MVFQEEVEISKENEEKGGSFVSNQFYRRSTSQIMCCLSESSQLSPFE
jgi:hypothetical protein